jgi:hypothetical protein
VKFKNEMRSYFIVNFHDNLIYSFFRTDLGRAHKRNVCNRIQRSDLMLWRGDLDSVDIEMSLAKVKGPKLPMFVVQMAFSHCHCHIKIK